MINPVLPAEIGQRRLPFFLAMEEWVARSLLAADYFFAWRVPATVICGRNQDMAAEVDMEYCRKRGIDVVRRRSGGGCVYADMDNWMFSYITPGGDVASTFSRYTTMIAEMLQSLGFDARATGRNDLVIDGRKVAGNAYYHLHERAIVHGTMLCDVDAATISRAITPSRAKLEAKGVKSVPARLISLKEAGLKMSVEELGSYATKFLCDTSIELGADAVAAIEDLEQRYYEPGFLYGHDKVLAESRAVQVSRGRVDGVGEIELRYTLTPDNRIADIDICGDFFVEGDPEVGLLRHLRGVSLSKTALADALAGVSKPCPIVGLEPEQVLPILID